MRVESSPFGDRRYRPVPDARVRRSVGFLFPSSYGLRKTSASDGCQQSTATRAFSAGARKGTQSGQTRAAKSESQNCNSTFFWHSRHWPEVFFVKDLIA